MLKADAQTTRERVVEAALEALKTVGFGGATAREIARRGGFNQALVFYYFGSVTGALLAALDATSERRMARYEAALQEAGSVEELLAVARELHREDLESGHVTVLSEMIAGSLPDPELAAAIAERIEPWMDFAERALKRALSGTPLETLLPTREIAHALVAFYVGLDLMNQLDPDPARTDRLFEVVGRFAPLTTMLGAR